ncbi:hypothetical protein [Chitinophaga solisilvae]|uniref:Uncharacterized protein n=1 Tax=Chitinophaga solisilvae TaxID=1233460 RepID=A0A9Q5DAE3_9BACT|nr:hypothetical protein [Chitinophaga solisilvae]NSL90138.1 hypothetical protein [Chitinophaga solisilvae]
MKAQATISHCSIAAAEKNAALPAAAVKDLEGGCGGTCIGTAEKLIATDNF